MASMLEGWDVSDVAVGRHGDARAEILRTGDGYVRAVVEPPTGPPPEHSDTEFPYVLAGRPRNHGRTIDTGDVYVAAKGASYTDFEAELPSGHLNIFKI